MSGFSGHKLSGISDSLVTARRRAGGRRGFPKSIVICKINKQKTPDTALPAGAPPPRRTATP